MLRRIQGWLKSAGGLTVAAACLASAAAYAEDENPKGVKPQIDARGRLTVQFPGGETADHGTFFIQVSAATEEKEATEKQTTPEKKEGEAKEGNGKVIHRDVVLNLIKGQEPAYWIGVHCEPVGEALRAQLKLDAGRGLIIEQVIADSPAAKAGLLPHDVLVQGGDTPLGEVSTLIDMVAKTKDGELKLKLIRGGETKTIVVKPAPRISEDGSGAGTLIFGESTDEAAQKVVQQLQKQLQELKKGKAGEEKVPTMQFFHPGVVLPPGASAPGQPGVPPNVVRRGWVIASQAAILPDDMTITISKSGKSPAKITVKQGEKSWETTDDKMDTLPAEIHEHVQRMLGRAPMTMPVWGATINTAQPKAGEAKPNPQPGANPIDTRRRVIELEVMPNGEFKRTEAKPGDPKSKAELDLAARLEALQKQLQDQSKRLQAKVTASAEEPLKRSLQELQEKFESVEQRLQKLEEQLLSAAKKGKAKKSAGEKSEQKPAERKSEKEDN